MICTLIADLGVRGVWQPQTEALFDIRVIDTDAQSNAHCSVNAVLATNLCVLGSRVKWKVRQAWKMEQGSS